MNQKSSIFVGIWLLLVLGILVSRGDIARLVVAEATDDTFIYLPILTKPNPPEYKIIFASDRDNVRGVYDIFIMNIDGTEIKNLTNTPDIAESYPTWSPDGTMIAYLSGEQGSTDVFIMSNTGDNKRNVSNAPSVDARGLVWFPDSTRLAFLSDRDDAEGIDDIFVVKNDGTGLTNLTQSTNSDERSLDWSPGGANIVYLSDLSLQPGIIGHVVTMNADGTNKTTIATNSGFNLNPIWSPDGSKIAFIIKGFSSDCLALINPDGTNQVCATTPSSIERVMVGILWDSSGSQILFEGLEAGSDQLDLFILKVSDSSITNVTMNVPDYGSPDVSVDWSADDTQVVYNEEVLLQGHDIFIINTNGTGHNNLTSSKNVDDRWPNWSPVPLP